MAGGGRAAGMRGGHLPGERPRTPTTRQVDVLAATRSGSASRARTSTPRWPQRPASYTLDADGSWIGPDEQPSVRTSTSGGGKFLVIPGARVSGGPSEQDERGHLEADRRAHHGQLEEPAERRHRRNDVERPGDD